MTIKTLKQYIKTPQEINKIRKACQLAAEVFKILDPHVKKGITTLELNQIAEEHMVKVQKAYPAPLTKGFPKAICTSVNHVICHGIPTDAKKLKDGDIVGIDVSLEYNGYFGDTCKMYTVGKPSIKAQRLVSVCQEALYKAIRLVKPGVSLKTIGSCIQNHVEANRYSVVREYCGHGIGSELHEDDFHVLHYDNPNVPDLKLEPGLTFTIEPMVNTGAAATKLMPDSWTVVTKDRSLSAQWEHTILVTDTGYEVLTLRPEEQI